MNIYMQKNMQRDILPVVTPKAPRNLWQKTAFRTTKAARSTFESEMVSIRRGFELMVSRPLMD